MVTNLKYLISFVMSLLLLGCGGGGGSTTIDTSASRFSISATVSGLASGKQLQLSNSSEFVVAVSNGVTSFKNEFATGSQYSVAIETQPVGQTCSVQNGAGTIASLNISNIVVTCVDNPVATYSVAFSVTGLGVGKTVTLSDGSNNQIASSNTNYTFSTSYLSGDSYSVTVASQPIGQTCTVTNASGSVSTNNIANIGVSCADNPAATYTVGLTVSGLGAGKQVSLQNAGDTITGVANTSYTFATAAVSGTNYSVSVTGQPVGQTCTVSSGSGTLTNTNITNVLVNCANNAVPTYSIGFTVTGLGIGKTLVLNDGNENKSITSNGSSTFTQKLASSSNYAVSIGTQPNLQFCKISNGSGTVNGSDVTNISISCSTIYSLNGSDLIYTPNLTGIVTGNAARTYNIWVRFPTPHTGHGTLLGQGTLSSYNRSALVITIPWAGYNNGTGAYALAFDFQVGGVWSPKFDINDTNWHMITATYDRTAAGTGVQFFLDGVVLANPVANVVNGFNKNSVNTINFNSSVTIGGESYDGTSLSASTGLIADLRNANAWSTVLSPSEISDIYNSVAFPTGGLFFSKD